MNDLNLIILLYFILFSIFSTNLTYNFLKKKAFIDKNSTKYSKDKNVVNSLGIVFLINFIIFTIYFIYKSEIVEYFPNRYYIFFLSIFLLSVISFFDDFREIDPKIRLIIQLIIVYFSTTNLELDKIGIPLKLILFLSLIIWVYIINVVNFLDGSNGNCFVHSIIFFTGILIISYTLNIKTFSIYLCYINIASLFVFIFFNFPAARAYMGDAGSVFLGYSIGYIFLEFIFLEKFLLIFSLLMYPFLDCTLTLILKISKGNKPWAKLFDYFFLIPIKNGQHHEKVFYSASIYGVLNLMFVYLQIKYTNLFFIVNILLAVLLLIYYRSFKKKDTNK